MLQKIKKGDPIKAKFLTGLADGVNSLEKAINSPAQVDELLPSEITNEDPDALPDYVFSESGRTTSTIQVFDQNDENYAEIERIESITFINGKGEILRLDFDNG